MPNRQCQIDNAKWTLGHGQWQMANAKWPMSNGQCQMVNARWQTPDDQCQMANAKWSMLDGQCQMTVAKLPLINGSCVPLPNFSVFVFRVFLHSGIRLSLRVYPCIRVFSYSCICAFWADCKFLGKK